MSSTGAEAGTQGTVLSALPSVLYSCADATSGLTLVHSDLTISNIQCNQGLIQHWRSRCRGLERWLAALGSADSTAADPSLRIISVVDATATPVDGTSAFLCTTASGRLALLVMAPNPSYDAVDAASQQSKKTVAANDEFIFTGAFIDAETKTLRLNHDATVVMLAAAQWSACFTLRREGGGFSSPFATNVFGAGGSLGPYHPALLAKHSLPDDSTSLLWSDVLLIDTAASGRVCYLLSAASDGTLHSKRLSDSGIAVDTQSTPGERWLPPSVSSCPPATHCNASTDPTGRLLCLIPHFASLDAATAYCIPLCTREINPFAIPLAPLMHHVHRSGCCFGQEAFGVRAESVAWCGASTAPTLVLSMAFERRRRDGTAHFFASAVYAAQTTRATYAVGLDGSFKEIPLRSICKSRCVGTASWRDDRCVLVSAGDGSLIAVSVHDDIQPAPLPTVKSLGKPLPSECLDDLACCFDIQVAPPTGATGFRASRELGTAISRIAALFTTSEAPREAPTSSDAASIVMSRRPCGLHAMISSAAQHVGARHTAGTVVAHQRQRRDPDAPLHTCASLRTGAATLSTLYASVARELTQTSRMQRNPVAMAWATDVARLVSIKVAMQLTFLTCAPLQAAQMARLFGACGGYACDVPFPILVKQRLMAKESLDQYRQKHCSAQLSSFVANLAVFERVATVGATKALATSQDPDVARVDHLLQLSRTAPASMTLDDVRELGFRTFIAKGAMETKRALSGFVTTPGCHPDVVALYKLATDQIESAASLQRVQSR